jgi:hypothetical protein
VLACELAWALSVLSRNQMSSGNLLVRGRRCPLIRDNRIRNIAVAKRPGQPDRFSCFLVGTARSLARCASPSRRNSCGCGKSYGCRISYCRRNSHRGRYSHRFCNGDRRSVDCACRAAHFSCYRACVGVALRHSGGLGVCFASIRY